MKQLDLEDAISRATSSCEEAIDADLPEDDGRIEPGFSEWVAELRRKTDRPQIVVNHDSDPTFASRFFLRGSFYGGAS